MTKTELQSALAEVTQSDKRAAGVSEPLVSSSADRAILRLHQPATHCE
jgi:hypothetical protein